MTAKQSFVDLGCGNGLLVHILSSEGVKHGSWPFLVSSLESVFKSSPRFIEIDLNSGIFDLKLRSAAFTAPTIHLSRIYPSEHGPGKPN